MDDTQEQSTSTPDPAPSQISSEPTFEPTPEPVSVSIPDSTSDPIVSPDLDATAPKALEQSSDPITPEPPLEIPLEVTRYSTPNVIQSLLIKAQAKIQFNQQKKLNVLMEFARKKGIVSNDDVQKLLRVSDATATRYLVKLVGQGRLIRKGSPRDAKYQFVR